MSKKKGSKKLSAAAAKRVKKGLMEILKKHGTRAASAVALGVPTSTFPFWLKNPTEGTVVALETYKTSNPTSSPAAPREKNQASTQSSPVYQQLSQLQKLDQEITKMEKKLTDTKNLEKKIEEAKKRWGTKLQELQKKRQ